MLGTLQNKKYNVNIVTIYTNLSVHSLLSSYAQNGKLYSHIKNVDWQPI